MKRELKRLAQVKNKICWSKKGDKVVRKENTKDVKWTDKGGGGGGRGTKKKSLIPYALDTCPAI